MIKQIKVFQTVAQTKSFSAAATQTGLSQPSISRLIRQLEDEMGAELIDRYHRPLQLTPAGVFFYEQTDSLLSELQSIFTMTKRMANPPQSLNIGFVPSILYGLLPQIINELKQNLPKLEVHLKDIPSYQQIPALKAGHIDIGFGRFKHQDRWIKQILLRHEKLVVALPSNHTLAQLEDDLHLSELSTNRLILYHQTHLMNTFDHAHQTETEPLLNLFERYGISVFNTTKVSDLQVALGLVAANEGITLVPDSLKALCSSQIVYKTLKHEDATSPIYLNFLEQNLPSYFHELLNAIYHIYEVKGITYRQYSH